MKKRNLKIPSAVVASLIGFAGVSEVAYANDFGNTFANTNNSASQLQSMMNQNMMNDMMQNLMNQNNNNLNKNNQNQKKEEKNPNLVTAVGYLTEEKGKYYIGAEVKEKYQIVPMKGDIEAVMPIVSDIEMPLKFEGEIDKQTKTIYVQSMYLGKKPSSRLGKRIQEALEEWERSQPVSAKGYIVQRADGNYYFKVKRKFYKIETDELDIKTILPMIVEEEAILIQLIGLLEKPDDEKPKDKGEDKKVDEEEFSNIPDDDEEDKSEEESEQVTFSGEDDEEEGVKETPKKTTSEIADEVFKVQKLNFLEELDEEFTKEMNEKLIRAKDGKEVDITGSVYTKEGTKNRYVIDFGDMEVEILPNGDHEEVPLVIELVKDKELKVRLTGIFDYTSGTLDASKIDVLDKPSNKLAEDINAVLEDYAEGDAKARGYIVSKDGELFFKVKKKLYKLSYLEEKDKDGEVIDRKDLKKFVEITKDTDTFVQLNGIISNRNLTFKIKGAATLGLPEQEIRDALADALEEYIEFPETGSEITAHGQLVKKSNNRMYLSVTYNDFLVKTQNKNIAIAMEHLEPLGIAVAVEGVIDKELKIIEAKNLIILEEMTKEDTEKLDKALREANGQGSRSNSNQQGSQPLTSASGSLFGTMNPNFSMLFGGNPEQSNNNSNQNSQSNQNNPFGNFGSLFSEMLSGNGNMGSLFSSLFGDSANSPMSSLSYDQITGQMNNLTKTYDNEKQGNKNSNQNSNQNQSGFGFGSNNTSNGNGFSVNN